MVNKKRRNILVAICIIVILALTAGFWIREKGKSVPENHHSEQTNEKSKADNSERSEQANASKKKEYTEEEKVKFEKYLEGQIAKIDLPNKDIPFLRNKILTMYANPLINYLEAAKG